MRRPFLPFLFALAAMPAAADRAAFFGLWGTPQQCARELIKPGGSVRAAPYEIGGEWLRQGALWCQLDWFPIERRGGGAFTGAHARCGEDAVRGYLLGMTLEGDALTLRWDVFRATAPMGRCPGG